MSVSQPLLIEPRSHDLGGLMVRRALPHVAARAVGPFVFFDHMGPADFASGQGVDVRPHPHIGLATVTYLFEGAITHRDSLGSQQDIRPGDVNWMTAGRGIVHSERTPAAERAAGHRLHGLQIWMALPQSAEEAVPEFHHHPAATLPAWEEAQGALHLRLVAGRYGGRQSPVHTFSPMFYLALEAATAAEFALDASHAERAVYVASGGADVDGQLLRAGQMLVLPAGAPVRVRPSAQARLALFGGAPLDGPRWLWWNFVSSSRERIEQAKADWRAQRFGRVPGETEFIPLP